MALPGSFESLDCYRWNIVVVLVELGSRLAFSSTESLEMGLMTYPFGGDSSKYSYVSFVVSPLMSVLLIFVCREQLIYEHRDSTRIRGVLMTVSLWTACASAFGLVAFSSYRWFHAPALGVHNGPVLVIAFSGLVTSLISLLSVFAVGNKRWLVVLSSLVLTIVWFLTVLDNISW